VYAELPLDDESLQQLLSSDETRQLLASDNLLDILPAQDNGKMRSPGWVVKMLSNWYILFISFMFLMHFAYHLTFPFNFS